MWPSRGGDPLAWLVTNDAWTILLSLLSCIQLDSDATPSIGRRRVVCSCFAGAVFLARIALLRRSGCSTSIVIWDYFPGGFFVVLFPLGIPKDCKIPQIQLHNCVDFQKC